MNSYSIFIQHNGCGICKRTSDGQKLYLQRVYKGNPTWCLDYSYSKLYAETTATKVLKNLRENDPECEED